MTELIRLFIINKQINIKLCQNYTNVQKDVEASKRPMRSRSQLAVESIWWKSPKTRSLDVAVAVLVVADVERGKMKMLKIRSSRLVHIIS